MGKETKKMKILIHYRHFPVAMGRFFDWAFRDLGHEVFSVGNYSGGRIPWGDEFNFPQYAGAPDYEIPEIDYPVDSLLKEIDFKPDVIVQAADVLGLTGKAPYKNVLLKTDPHAVDYTKRQEFVDHVFNMQHHYSTVAETWIPYAHYPGLHQFRDDPKMVHDVVFSGLQYEHRLQALNGMKEAGLKVFCALGVVYEEYVKLYNQGLIAFNWSSKMDLPARFWEGMAMKRLMLTNLVPDLVELTEFKDGVDYVGFTTVEDAIEKALFYTKNKEAREKIAENGYAKVQRHTYQSRAQDMIDVINRL